MKKKIQAIWKVIKSDSFFLADERDGHLVIDSTMTKIQIRVMIRAVKNKLDNEG